ncbi:uncharacterized protein LOC134772294 [Penaeus indicus]|uniref:uncharacterized protein LOC134772294 n=1 Tax=Penaeus indicus TaxID=29960 RepID=UPI00300C8D48
MAGLQGAPKTFANLKIEVPNDLQIEDGELPEDPGTDRMEEDELEEGEASEDDVEVNVIIRDGDTGGPVRGTREPLQGRYEEGVLRGRRVGVTDAPNLDSLVFDVRPEKKYENRSGGGFVSGVYEVRTLAVIVREFVSSSEKQDRFQFFIHVFRC